MSFKFNFPMSNSEVEVNAECLNFTLYEKDPNKEDSSDDISSCGFLSIPGVDEVLDENITSVKLGDLIVPIVSVKSLQHKSETLSKVEALKSDIIPHKYEGGFKIWECSVDLAVFIKEENICKSGDVVLELGCGAGLPGLIAYRNGASVTFQDFNSEVLKLMTYPNTLLNNFIPCGSQAECEFLYGDWSCIKAKYYSDDQCSKKYDIILTSETIYEKSNQRKLLDLMKSALKPKGKIYLASKIHYFGVGGGIADFEALVKDDGSFEISTVKSIKDGLERQILKMSFKNS